VLQRTTILLAAVGKNKTPLSNRIESNLLECRLLIFIHVFGSLDNKAMPTSTAHSAIEGWKTWLCCCAKLFQWLGILLRKWSTTYKEEGHVVYGS
jgi:hypothetical protein